jgi:UDP-MurNAc hydroxylase
MHSVPNPAGPSSPVRFRILSHAGLLVTGAGKTLLFDPWLVGSAYWRSWWNFPPVPRDLVESLRPDFIYLTHIHWDHFHGPSLRKFPRETPIFIPKTPARRMKQDLLDLGFTDVTEIGHGRSLELAPGLKLTSYHFFPFTDSAAVVECGGVTLFNANDAKVMGAPLDQILARHPRIDFVFRSHSSANERVCYDFMDDPRRTREHPAFYLNGFAAFARKVKARYAIPFASNHCYLHRETWHFNDTVVTPAQVETHCRALGMERPEAKAMVCGDSWSSETGFSIAAQRPGIDRESVLREYASDQSAALEKSYALEARTDVTLAQVEWYFTRFMKALPWAARRAFKGRQVTFVLTGKAIRRFWIDLHRGVVREIAAVDDDVHPLQLHTSSYVFRRCMAQNLFTHLGISKRLLFRCRVADGKYFRLLILLFTMYESEMLPLRRLLAPKFLMSWIPRWREVWLYSLILTRLALGRPFEMRDYLRTDAPVRGRRSRLFPRSLPLHAAEKRL